MSSFTYRVKDGHKRYCTCYRSECSIECGLYREYTGIKTNYDRLISKTPEELAEFIVKIKYPYRADGQDYAIALAWLKSPVEVDNG